MILTEAETATRFASGRPGEVSKGSWKFGNAAWSVVLHPHWHSSGWCFGTCFMTFQKHLGISSSLTSCHIKWASAQVPLTPLIGGGVLQRDVTPHGNCCCFQSERMRFFPGIETDGGETTEFLKCLPIAKPRWCLLCAGVAVLGLLGYFDFWSIWRVWRVWGLANRRWTPIRSYCCGRGVPLSHCCSLVVAFAPGVGPVGLVGVLLLAELGGRLEDLEVWKVWGLANGSLERL